MRDFKPMWSATAFWYAETPTDAESSNISLTGQVRNLTPGIPAGFDRGHRILLQRGLQLQTTVLDLLIPAEQLYQDTFVSIHHGDECDLFKFNTEPVCCFLSANREIMD